MRTPRAAGAGATAAPMAEVAKRTVKVAAMMVLENILKIVD
jgi:hypothetical protein